MSTDDLTRTAVAADMERIFAGITRREAATRIATGEPIVPLTLDEESRSSILWLLALAAVLSIGAVAAALILLPPTLRSETGPAPAASPTLASTSAQRTVQTVEQIVPISPPPAVGIAATPDPVPADAATPSPTGVREPRASEPREGRATANRSAARGSTASRERVSPRTLCRDVRNPEQCLYREVRRADLRLREAYESASDLNIPVAEMRRVRRSWNRALDRSLDDPVGTVRTLDGLTARLDEAQDDLVNGSRR